MHFVKFQQHQKRQTSDEKFLKNFQAVIVLKTNFRLFRKFWQLAITFILAVKHGVTSHFYSDGETKYFS